VGKRRFEKAVEAFDGEVEIEWRSFELDPGAPERHEDPLDVMLARKYRTSLEGARQMLERMTQTAAEEGLAFDFDRARGGNTLDAHRVLHMAKERGLGDAMKERLLSAYMVEGRPISDRGELADLAAEVGLDRDAVATMLAGDAYVERVRADERDARANGVTGVPFFVFEETYRVSGAQTPDVLLDVLERAREHLVDTDTQREQSSARCDEDGCRVE
jgi:predicted DsbA family dithiol-disulfide isomerase